MKISFLVIGIIFFFLGAYTGMKLFVAIGIILVIISFFGKVIKKEEKDKKEPLKQKWFVKSEIKCSNCGAELLSEDNFCPECGKKVLP